MITMKKDASVAEKTARVVVRKNKNPRRRHASAVRFGVCLAIMLAFQCCLTGCIASSPMSGKWYQDTDEGTKTLVVPERSGGTWQLTDSSSSSPYYGCVLFDSDNEATFSLESLPNGDSETASVADQANSQTVRIMQGKHIVMCFDGVDLEGYYDEPSKTSILDGVWHR